MGNSLIATRDPEAVNMLLRGVRSGAYLSAACQFAGLNYNTVKSWVAQGRRLIAEHENSSEEEIMALPERDRQLIELVLELDKATAGVEVAAAATIIKATQNGEWRAAAWLLEHRFPGEWSEKKQLQVSGQVEMVDMTTQRAEVTAALNELHERLNEIDTGDTDDVVDAEIIEDHDADHDDD